MFGWPYAGIAARMQRHPTEVRQLTRFRQRHSAHRSARRTGFRAACFSGIRSKAAVRDADEYAIIMALMQESGLVQIASRDADFDGIPGLTRFGPA